MSGLSAILSFRLPALWFKKGKPAFPIYPIILAIHILLSSYESFSEERVQYLKKVGEIKEGFSSEKENFFVKITGLCCDDEGNLYVADSGWNKIFKFDPNGKFIMSFGREGQGPGEFLAHPMRAHLKISFGNDGKLYVNDPGNGRLSIFSKEGNFIKSFKLPPFTYDAPVVNSKGDIYLLSKSGIKVIDCYDSNFKYKASLLDIEEHLKFPFGKPSERFLELKNPQEDEVLKAITEDDLLIVVSNYSLKAFVFDNRNTLSRVFKIFPPELERDYKMKIKETKKKENEMKRRSDSKATWAWVFPFYNLFIPYDGIIGLSYIKEDGEKTIHNWDLKGKPLGKIICPRTISFIWDTTAMKRKKYFFVEGIEKENITIGIYELKFERR